MPLPGALAQHPVLDPKTGLISRPWLLFLNSLATGTFAGSAAPADASYLVGALNGTLTAERLVTDTTSIAWDLATAGQAKATRAALTGDVTASANANATTIANNAVSDAKLRDSGACSVIGRSANSSGDPADISAASNGTVLRRSSNALAFAAVSMTADITGITPSANGGTGIAYFTAAGPTVARVYTFPDAAVTIASLTGTETLTNKRITKRVVTAADATSVTPNSDNADITYQANTQAAGTLTINADGGTPTNGQSWVFKVKSTNVQTFAWNAIFAGGTTALPTATTGSSKFDYFAFLYDSVTPKWHYTGSAVGF